MNKQNYEIHESSNTVDLDKPNQEDRTYEKSKQENNFGMREIPIEQDFKPSSIGSNNNDHNQNNQQIGKENTNIQENINTNTASNYETLDESVWETLVYLY